MTDTDELLPCPFCGGKAHIEECTHCGELNIIIEHETDCWMVNYEWAYDVAGEDRSEYVAAWNRRADHE